MLSFFQAAKHLCVTPRTVAKWVDSGRLKATDKRIAVADLISFMQAYDLRIPDALQELANDRQPDC